MIADAGAIVNGNRSALRDVGGQWSVGRVGTRAYEALRFDTLAQPISILPQGDRKFSILHSQFSIQQQDGGLGSGRPTAWTEQLRP